MRLGTLPISFLGTSHIKKAQLWRIPACYFELSEPQLLPTLPARTLRMSSREQQQSSPGAQDFQTMTDAGMWQNSMLGGNLTLNIPPETPRITVQPLRSTNGSLQYHIDIRLAGSDAVMSDTVVLAPSLERILPVAFEHIQDLVESGLVRTPLFPYHIIFEEEIPADGLAVQPTANEEG